MIMYRAICETDGVKRGKQRRQRIAQSLRLIEIPSRGAVVARYFFREEQSRSDETYARTFADKPLEAK
jgi:hypothetical protein